MKAELHDLAPFSPDCRQLLALLHLADSGCEAVVLEALAGLSRDALKDELARLKEQGRIKEERECFFVVDRRFSAQALAAFAGGHSSSGTPFFQLLRLHSSRNYREFFQKACTGLESLLTQKRWLLAKRFLDCMHSLFLSCRIPATDADLCRDFIRTSYNLLYIQSMFPWLNRKTLAWLFKARGLAFAIHDDHLLALADLSIGYLEINDFSLHRSFSYSKYLKRGLELSLSLGDEELIARAMPYNALMYYKNGEFLKAVNCIYSQFYRDKKRHYDVYHRTLYANGVLSAIYSGEYDIAIDIARSGQRTAEDLGREQDAQLLLTYVAYVLLLKGEENKCLEIINPILARDDDAVLTYAGLWAARILAYYHCLRGELAASYECYISRLRKASLTGVIHTGHASAHFLLDMLARFHIAGFPQPMQRGIDEELENSIHSANQPLKMSALCLKGELCAHKRGWADPEAAACMQAALNLARSFNAPVEQAKILLLQTRIMLHAGRMAEAHASFEEALALHRRYHSPSIPDDLQKLLEATPAVHPSVRPTPHKEKKTGDIERFFSFQSEPMRDMQRKIELLAAKNTPVLLLGESGVGKEQAARQLHQLSGRTGAFVPVNLASVPEELFESEFYGHEKGSFTGAHNLKKGLFEIADQGTLFLDEVGDIPPRIQVKLLRVLQEKQFMRVGGTQLLQSDFRLVSATNKEIKQEMREEKFRPDLFYRISVVSLTIPPLRERGNDLLLLANFFLRHFLDIHKLPSRVFRADDIEFILSYSWPGNIRELKNYMERFVLLAENERPGDEGLPALPGGVSQPEHAPPAGNVFARLPPDVFAAGFPSMDEIKDQYFEYVYEHTCGTVGGRNGVLDVLKISKATAYHWIQKLRLGEKFARKMVRIRR